MKKCQKMLLSQTFCNVIGVNLVKMRVEIFTSGCSFAVSDHVVPRVLSQGKPEVVVPSRCSAASRPSLCFACSARQKKAASSLRKKMLRLSSPNQEAPGESQATIKSDPPQSLTVAKRCKNRPGGGGGGVGVRGDFAMALQSGLGFLKYNLPQKMNIMALLHVFVLTDVPAGK